MPSQSYSEGLILHEHRRGTGKLYHEPGRTPITYLAAVFWGAGGAIFACSALMTLRVDSTFAAAAAVVCLAAAAAFSAGGTAL